MKKQKCKVCGKRFDIKKDAVYQVRPSVSFTEAFTKESSTYDAVDCPNCGCQHRLAVRWGTVKGGAE